MRHFLSTVCTVPALASGQPNDPERQQLGVSIQSIWCKNAICWSGMLAPYRRHFLRRYLREYLFLLIRFAIDCFASELY